MLPHSYSGGIARKDTDICRWYRRPILERVLFRKSYSQTVSNFSCHDGEFRDINSALQILITQCARIAQFKWVCIKRLNTPAMSSVYNNTMWGGGGQGKKLEGFGEIKLQGFKVVWVRRCVCEVSTLTPAKSLRKRYWGYGADHQSQMGWSCHEILKFRWGHPGR